MLAFILYLDFIIYYATLSLIHQHVTFSYSITCFFFWSYISLNGILCSYISLITLDSASLLITVMTVFRLGGENSMYCPAVFQVPTDAAWKGQETCFSWFVQFDYMCFMRCKERNPVETTARICQHQQMST